MKTTFLFRGRKYLRWKRFWCVIAVGGIFCFCQVAFADVAGRQDEEDTGAIEARLQEVVEDLASDEMEGRGVGTNGIDLAADHIVKQFIGLGLKATLSNGSWFQEFSIATGANGGGSMSDRSALAETATVGKTAQSEEASMPRESGEEPTQPPINPITLKNIVGSLEGEGALAQETIVIGAHYDHLGVGNSKGGERVVYHGANDNASGVAAMLEVAHILAHRNDKLPRRVVFVAFSGEELGLKGSSYYVDDPPVDLDKTIAMINLDMVGRLQGDALLCLGSATSSTIAAMTGDIAKRHEMKLLEIPHAAAGSDHVPFCSRRIPVVFFVTTGGRSEMHKPSDVAGTLNYPGMRRIAQITADLTVALATSEQRPEFCETGTKSLMLRNAARLWGWVFDTQDSEKSKER